MSTRNAIAIVLTLWSGLAAAADTNGFGRPIAEADIAPWDISIGPDGVGLPPGSGTPQQGAVVYAQKCVACHGQKGVGRPADRLVGGPLPVKSVGSYWPYATTLFDFIRRAMPWTAPKSLTNDEGLCSERLYSRTERYHWRKRRDECNNVTKGGNAQPERIHPPVPCQALNLADDPPITSNAGAWSRNHGPIHIPRCLVDLGRRTGEVANLRLEDPIWRAGTLRLKRTKAERVDRLPLLITTGQAIAPYLQQRTTGHWLFVSQPTQRDEPITVGIANYAMRQTSAHGWRCYRRSKCSSPFRREAFR